MPKSFRWVAVVGALLSALVAGGAAAQSVDTLEKGSFTIAFTGDMPGTGYQDGKMIGYDGEILQRIADALKLKVKPALMEWSGTIASVQAKRVDVMAGTMGWTEQRTKIMTLSDPIHYFKNGITQQSKTNWASLKDLEGKKVGTITGFSFIPELRRISGLQLSLYDTYDAAVRDLLAGRIDAVIGDPRDDETQHVPLRPALPGIEGRVEGLRVWALPAAEREGCDDAVLAAYDRCLQELEGLGLRIVERALPQRLDESMRLAGALMSAEGYANLGALFEQDLRFDPHVRRRDLAGRACSAARYLELQRQRAEAQAAMRQAMDGIDLCCFPTNAISAIPVAEVDEDATPLSRLCRFANWLDLCSVAVPAGLSPEGLPVSVQFVGRPWDEPLALRAARAYERATRATPALPPRWE